MARWSRLLWWSVMWLVIGLIPLAIGWSHMPDPMATHWGASGVADGRMPLALVPLIMVFMIGVGLLTSSMFRWEGKPTAEAVAMIGLLGAMGLVLNASLVVLNWDVESWEVADPFVWWHIVVVVAAGVGGVYLGYWLGKQWFPPPRRDRSASPGAVVDVADGETVSWTGTTTVRWPLLVVGGVGVIFLFMADWWPVLGILFIALGFLFTAVYVTVNDRGLEVRLGGRIPVKRIDLASMTHVAAIDLEPARWGGWGYRVAPGRSAVVLRRGDAIEVTLPDDRQFAVTVDDAGTAAALLNGLIVRLERSAG